MLSLERYRTLLGTDSDFPDSELERIRQEARNLAHACIAAAMRGRQRETPFHQAIATIPPDARDEAEERAAIIEFDGKIPRRHAEKLAVLRHMRRIR